VFCKIVAGTEPADIVFDWPSAIVIVPLNPVTPGHLLVIPRKHVRDASELPELTGFVAAKAAEFAKRWTKDGDYNLIVNCGSAASMTVPHLHWHIVPRFEGDGLALPWTGQHRPAPTHLDGDQT
jgi:histidine triad (HIT) family protein